MSQPQSLILETYLKRLKLPSIARQSRKLASQAAQSNLTHEQFLLAVVEQEVSNREENTCKQRIRQARFLALIHSANEIFQPCPI